jgi:hypothetical protein
LAYTIPGNRGLAGVLSEPENNLVYVSNQGHRGIVTAVNKYSVISGTNGTPLDSVVIPGESSGNGIQSKQLQYLCDEFWFKW